MKRFLLFILTLIFLVSIFKLNDKNNTPKRSISSKAEGIKHKISKDDPVLLAVGDIAYCDHENDELVAKLLKKLPGTIALLGDTVYENGTWDEFMKCFDPEWGELKPRIKPVIGNHEYHEPNRDAWPYFKYFGSAAGEYGKGYYSYNLGSWHIIALNSQICDTSTDCINSEQIKWLKNDLEQNKSKCTLFYRHHPRFSSGANHGSTTIRPFWEVLYKYGAEIALSGHDHDYERFSPMTPDGELDNEHGIRAFVVGTGGLLTGFGKTTPNSEVRNNTSYGVLKLTLHKDSYEWEFIPVPGNTFRDKGEGRCHDAPPK